MAHIKDPGTISSEETSSMQVYKLIWTIDYRNFSDQVGHEYSESPHFFIGANEDYEWRIDIFAAGFDADLCDYMSIRAWQLNNRNSNEFVAQFSILDSEDKKHWTKTVPVTEGEGLIQRFLNREVLARHENVFLKNGLRIACQIVDLSSVVNKNKRPRNEPLEGFEKLLTDQKFSDVILLVQEKEFHAHKAILAARSTVFEAVFETNVQEVSEGKITINDIEPEVMKRILCFIYTGKVEIEDMIDKILIAAERFQLDSLKIQCENELVKRLTISNIYHILTFADQNNAVKLKRAAITFFDENLRILVAADDFTMSVDSLPGNLKTEIIRVYAMKSAGAAMN